MTPLPKQSIDTGAGLERVVSLKMGVDSVFETDILRSLIAEVEQISGKKYDPTMHNAPAFHVIADHIRSLSFCDRRRRRSRAMSTEAMSCANSCAALSAMEDCSDMQEPFLG